MIVVKVGGGQLGSAGAVVAEVLRLRRAGAQVVLVHGGGPQLDAVAARQGIVSQSVAGRRVTSQALLEAAQGEWRGRLSLAWVRALSSGGLPAVGLSGVDGDLVLARRRPPVTMVDDDGREQVVDYGHVGDVHAVRPTVLSALLAADLVPVVSPLAGGPDGVLNVNADTVAAEIAVSMSARRLMLLTGAPGLLADPEDPSSCLARVALAELDELQAGGSFKGGMRPKIAAVRRALAGGVAEARIASPDQPGGGTLITADACEACLRVRPRQHRPMALGPTRLPL